MTPRVPRLWPGATIVCIGGGPSLTPADIATVRGRARVIAVNDAYRLAPWADVLYACDQQWWNWHAGVPTFAGWKYGIASSVPITWPDVVVLENTGWLGLEEEPTGLRAGHNGGYQAVNLAVHLGAARILLLGYDMAPDGAQTHWFGDHPDHVPSPFPEMRAAFDTLVAPLAARGVEVLNCSRRTALTAFPRVPLEQALAATRVDECHAHQDRGLIDVMETAPSARRQPFPITPQGAS